MAHNLSTLQQTPRVFGPQKTAPSTDLAKKKKKFRAPKNERPKRGAVIRQKIKKATLVVIFGLGRCPKQPSPPNLPFLYLFNSFFSSR
jgi:hypothetical protein